MIKLSAGLSVKMPVPDVQFSSSSCSAGIEVEMPSGLAREEILDHYRKLYSILQKAVDEQLKSPPARASAASPTSSGRKENQRASRNNGARKATEAQISAIRAIAAEKKLSDDELAGLVAKHGGGSDVSELSIRQASELISALKKNGKAG